MRVYLILIFSALHLFVAAQEIQDEGHKSTIASFECDAPQNNETNLKSDKGLVSAAVNGTKSNRLKNEIINKAEKLKLKIKNTRQKLKSRKNDGIGTFLFFVSILIILGGFTLIILTTILPWWWFLIGLGVIILGLFLLIAAGVLTDGEGGGLLASFVGIITLAVGAAALVVWGLVELLLWIF